MACVINYNNKTYSLEDFKNILLQDSSLIKEVANKSQERLKAIQEVFNSNLELSRVGDVFSYAIYLDTIFPDSEVKDIVYHGTNERFDRFDFNKEKTDPFTKEGAYFATTPYGYSIKLPAILNIKNPKEFEDITDTSNGFGELEKSTEFDSAIGKSTASGYESYREYVVFEPEQIHILSSKADIQGFKDFVNNKYSKLKGGIKGLNNWLNSFSTSETPISKETRSVLDFINTNYSKIADNTTISNDEELFDGITEGTPFIESRGIYAVDDETGEIYIVLNKRYPNKLEEALVHELTHAFTDVILNNPETEQEIKFVDTVTELYEEFKKMPGAEKLNKGYQFNSLSEFLTFSLTNTAMQKFIRKNEKSKSLWKKVIDFIKFLFGIKTKQFDKLFIAFQELVNTTDYSVIRDRLKGEATIRGLNVSNDYYSDNITPTQVSSEITQENPAEFSAYLESIIENSENNPLYEEVLRALESNNQIKKECK